MGLGLNIQDGVYKFLLTGNNKLLVKQFTKAEKKNDLILFEKRYEKYLYDNNFQKPDNEFIKDLKSNKKSYKITKLVNALILIAGFVIGIVLSETLSTLLVEAFYKNDLFLGCTSSGITSIFFIIGFVLLAFTIAYKLPFDFFKNKIEKIYKKEYNKVVLIVGIALVIIGSICIAYTFKNHAIYINENDVLYIDNEPTTESDNVEFILIKGYEYEDENNKIIYCDAIEDRDLLYVFDGEYEYYQYCQIYSEDLTVTNHALSRIKKADCKLSSYRTLEEFAEKNGFELEEE